MTTREMLELMGEIDERNGGRVDKFLREQEAGAQEGTTSSGAARHLPQRGRLLEADEEAPEADTEE